VFYYNTFDLTWLRVNLIVWTFKSYKKYVSYYIEAVLHHSFCNLYQWLIIGDNWQIVYQTMHINKKGHKISGEINYGKVKQFSIKCCFCSKAPKEQELG
jgi:hypothetical protein